MSASKETCACGQTFKTGVKHYCEIAAEANALSKSLSSSTARSPAEAVAAADAVLQQRSIGGGGGGNGARGMTGFAFDYDGASIGAGFMGGGGDGAEEYEPLPKTSAENIQVVVRVRPLLEHEASGGRDAVPIVDLDPPDGKSLVVRGAHSRHNLRCRFDAVFGADSAQADVYQHVQSCAKAVADGFNATIFAYGQTGSGKSHTMFGPPGHIQSLSYGGNPDEDSGIIPRAILDVFKHVEAARKGGGNGGGGGGGPKRVQLYCSFVQIYNEQIFDMLRDPKRGNPLEVHEDPREGIYVQGLSEYSVRTVNDCVDLLRLGEDNRAIRETHMNQASSRSHSIFQILVEQRAESSKQEQQQHGHKPVVTRSKFNLVDLAGSEKWDVKQLMGDDRVAEMTNINLSLYTLGRCIAALALSARRSLKAVSGGGGAPLALPPGGASAATSSNHDEHIPYRESKLTRLLQDSLGGNAKTRVIATLSPASDCAEESVSTLKFADRAKDVMVFVRKNEQRQVDFKLVERLQKEVAHLRRLLQQVAASGGGGPLPASAAARAVVDTSPIVSSPSSRGRDLGAMVDAPVASGSVTPGGVGFGSMSGASNLTTDTITEQQRKIAALSGENRRLMNTITELQRRQEQSLPSVANHARIGGAVPSGGGGADEGASYSSREGVLGARIEALQQSNEALVASLQKISDISASFFRFDIEEQELKEQLDSVIRSGLDAHAVSEKRFSRLKKETGSAAASAVERAGVPPMPRIQPSQQHQGGRAHEEYSEHPSGFGGARHRPRVVERAPLRAVVRGGGGGGHSGSIGAVGALADSRTEVAAAPLKTFSPHTPPLREAPRAQKPKPLSVRNGAALGAAGGRGAESNEAGGGWSPNTQSFRVRGKGGQEQVVQTEGDEQAKLEAELAAAKKRMKKQLKIQEWLRKKEEKELEMLDQEEQKFEDEEKKRKKKEKERKRRAKKNKQQLAAYYEKLVADAQADNSLGSLDGNSLGD